MPTPVFLTVDTEFAWRHHAAGFDVDTIYARSIEPAGVGIGYQLDAFARHGLKACFFVDPMPALVYGIDPVRRIVDTILRAGQEVQLHIHANWAGARLLDRSVGRTVFELRDYTAADQIALIARARDLLVAAGAPAPIAFRAGSYAANDDTLAALSHLGFAYDSSHNGAEAAWPSGIGLPADQVSPVRRGPIEVPVTVLRDGRDTLRPFQLCALSAREAHDALSHAADANHAAVTIVNHGFELANRAGTHPNAVHVRRFDALCHALMVMRDRLPTTWFADRPDLALDRHDVPLGPHGPRTRWRQVEQLWSNLFAERQM